MPMDLIDPRRRGRWITETKNVKFNEIIILASVTRASNFDASWETSTASMVEITVLNNVQNP